jgi:hypothetical protein
VDAKWHSLVAETQFASELTISGLRRLCTVPTDIDPDRWIGDDRNYVLPVGLHAFSSGLERLCKLTIACYTYATTGSFPRLRDFSHRIGELLDAVEALDRTQLPRQSKRQRTRPAGAIQPDLIATVERYASGGGRYEHLDSLWRPDAVVSTYKEWVALSRRASVPAEVGDLMSMRSVLEDVVMAELIEAGLEVSAETFVQGHDRGMHEASVGVVLDLFRQVRWVSTVLIDATDQTHPDLPILSEVVGAFGLSSTDFFAYVLAGLADDQAVAIELESVLPRMEQRERDAAD